MMVVVVAITSQVCVGNRRKASMKQASDLRFEQYTGVCQAPQALGDYRSAQSLDQTQTPIFFLCVDTCPSLSHAAQVQMVL